MGSQPAGAFHFETGIILGETIDLLNSQVKIGFGFDMPWGTYRGAFGNTMEFNVVYSWLN